jgi:hypothetical protein
MAWGGICTEHLKFSASNHPEVGFAMKCTAPRHEDVGFNGTPKAMTNTRIWRQSTSWKQIESIRCLHERRVIDMH